MTDLIVFIIFSTIEYLALMYFTFVLFRLSLRHYTYHLIFISLFLSYLSYTLRFAGIEFASSFVTMIVVFLFVWLMFRVQVFYAFVVAMTGYLVYALVQGLFLLALIWSGWMVFEDVQPNTALGSSIQFGTAAMVMALARIVVHFRWGFDIVPHSEFTKVKLEYEKRMLLIVNIVSFLVFGVTYLVVMYFKLYEAIYMLFCVNLISLVLILYFARKNDKREEEKESKIQSKGYHGPND